MLFERMEIGQEFDYFGQRFRKIEERKIHLGLGYTDHNIELVDQGNGYVSGYLAGDTEILNE